MPQEKLLGYEEFGESTAVVDKKTLVDVPITIISRRKVHTTYGDKYIYKVTNNLNGTEVQFFGASFLDKQYTEEYGSVAVRIRMKSSNLTGNLFYAFVRES
jgi:hypothetical protein